MAFVTKNPNGKGYVVRQGRTGQILSTHKDKKEAESRMRFNHAKHQPKASSKGKTAQKNVSKRLKEEKKKLPKTKFSPDQPKGKKAGVHRTSRKKRK